MAMRFLFLCSALLLAAGCASTKVESTWHDDAARAQYSNVLVVAVLEYPPYRKLVEEEITYHIRAAGGTANAVADVLGTTDEIDKAAAESAIKKTGADAVMLVRLIGRTEEDSQVPPALAVQGIYEGRGWYGAYYYSLRVVKLDGYTEEFTTSRIETTIFDAASEKKVWSAITDTTEVRPSDALNSYIKAVGKELRESGLFAVPTG